MKQSIGEVYEVVLEERVYQDSLAPTSDVNGIHTVTEWVAYINAYAAEALKMVSTTWGSQADEKGLDAIRKITAMGFACMEQNGIVRRIPKP